MDRIQRFVVLALLAIAPVAAADMTSPPPTTVPAPAPSTPVPPAPPPPSGTTAPLPTASNIYGAIPEGAVYLFRTAYLDCGSGYGACADGALIQRARNVASPGTRDMTFPSGSRPVWDSDGGPDARGCAQLDGINDHGEAVGFSFVRGAGTNNPSIQVVGNIDVVTNTIGVGVGLFTANGSTFLNAMHLRTMSGDFYRANGYLVNAPHNLDYLRPEASRDTRAHLHETHAYSTGMVALVDGISYGRAGGGGTTGTLDRLRIGRSYYAEMIKGCISEVVITEGRTTAEAASYRALRIAVEYPSLGL